MASPFVNDDGYCAGFKDGVKKAGEMGSGQQTTPVPTPEPGHIHVMYDGGGDGAPPEGSMVKVFAPDGVTEVELTAVGSNGSRLFVVNGGFAPRQVVNGVATFYTSAYDNTDSVKDGSVFVRYSCGASRGPVVRIPGSEVVYEE